MPWALMPTEHAKGLEMSNGRVSDPAPDTDLSGGWAKSVTNPGGFLGSYVRPDGSRVYLYTRGGRGQLFDAAGARVGPEQTAWARAVAYAHAEGWGSVALLSAGIIP